MKKLMNIFAAALVMLAAVGCEKNETLPDNSSKVITLSAAISNAGTKTSLGGIDNRSYPVLWSKGDAIAVINNGKLFKFVLDDKSVGTKQGTFTCSTPTDFNGAAPVQAFYPYEGVTYESSTIRYTVPETQTYQTSSFGQGAMPMAGYAANASGVVSFENLFGVVKLQLKGDEGENVRSIEIFSSNKVSRASEVTINNNQRYITLNSTNALAKRVVLDCGTDGVELNTNTATEFLITVPAGATNLRIVISTTEETYYKEIPSQNGNSELINTITAGKILKMPVLNIAEMTPTYVDNGVDHGAGIQLPASDGSIIWAPVNCGYDESHKYGLLYQWGRKYGQGYSDETPTVGIYFDQLSDAEAGSLEANRNNFYYGVANWLTSNVTDLWYDEDGASTTKTDYDPCPAGWRVPTIAELNSLSNSTSQWWTDNSDDSNHSGLPGFWFYGNTGETTGKKVFFPAAGYREYNTGTVSTRDNIGVYWSSTVTGTDKAQILQFASGTVTSTSGARANGYSVRCVKD